jgi:hypothetical protein
VKFNQRNAKYVKTESWEFLKGTESAQQATHSTHHKGTRDPPTTRYPLPMSSEVRSQAPEARRSAAASCAMRGGAREQGREGAPAIFPTTRRSPPPGPWVKGAGAGGGPWELGWAAGCGASVVREAGFTGIRPRAGMLGAELWGWAAWPLGSPSVRGLGRWRWLSLFSLQHSTSYCLLPPTTAPPSSVLRRQPVLRCHIGASPPATGVIDPSSQFPA